MVKVNKRYHITEHGIKIWGTNFKLTVFSFHKFLLTAGILVAVLFDLTKSSQVSKNWKTPALPNGVVVTASSEWPGTSVRNARLETKTYSYLDHT